VTTQSLKKCIVWKYAEGIPNVQAALSIGGDYVISHRRLFTLSYRPKIPGDRWGSVSHTGLGNFESLDAAKAAAEEHRASLEKPR
jgi:hypothetical protein